MVCDDEQPARASGLGHECKAQRRRRSQCDAGRAGVRAQGVESVVERGDVDDGELCLDCGVDAGYGFAGPSTCVRGPQCCVSRGDGGDRLAQAVDVDFMREDRREIKVGEDQIRVDVIGATRGCRSVDDRFLEAGEG
ncbi:Uncharacterised protein [Mycobacteroides abscessus subsp. abscessus]|nr:Uncharacterised protein [Mycobacteroides abscessus subsp. abscessus]